MLGFLMVSKHCCEIKRSRFVQIGKKLVGSYKKVAGIIERLCQNVKIGLPSKYKKKKIFRAKYIVFIKYENCHYDQM